MALVAGWTLLGTEDLGEGAEPDCRRTRVVAMAETPDDDFRMVTVELDLPPESLEAWVARVSGRRIEP